MADKSNAWKGILIVLIFLVVFFVIPYVGLSLKGEVQYAPSWNPSVKSGSTNVVPGDIQKKDFCPRTTYTIGEAYPGQDKDNPDWVWLLDNLHDSYYATDISQPNLITGPVLGVANAFEGNDLGDEPLLEATTWEERLGWSLPNDYRRVFYTGTEDYNSGWYTWPKAKVTTKYLDSFDTTQARNVPQALRQYLKTNAKVVELSTENAENIPSLFASYQMEHTTSYIAGFGANWTDENNSWYYYLAVSDVHADHSIDISFNKVCKENGEWCGELLETRNLPLRTEAVFESPEGDTLRVYNYLSNYYKNPDEQWRESAVVYRYGEDEERTTITPTFKIYLQPIMQDNKRVFLPFYIDYDTGELIYIKAGDQNKAHNFYWFTHDYFYFEPRMEISYDLVFGDYFVIDNYYYRPFWEDPRGQKYYEHLLTLFKTSVKNESGNRTLEITSLGNDKNTPEAEEFIYFYGDSDSRVDEIQLGLKEGKFKTSNGVDVEEPALNSETEDKVVHYLPPFIDYAMLNLFDPHSHSGSGTSIPLGRNVFTDDWERQNYNYGDGFPWELDYRYWSDEYGQYYNYLNLQKGVINFNNQQFNIHESLVFGTDTPRVETSLTKNQDEYQDVAYVETEPAYKDGQAYNNAGFKYIYAFDDSIDLRQASEDNPLTIEFLGRCLEIVGVPSYNQITTRPCGCKIEKHIGCEFNVCKEVDGPGDDECRTNDDCDNWPPPVEGSRCINDSGGPMCFRAIGIEGFECGEDIDCLGGCGSEGGCEH